MADFLTEELRRQQHHPSTGGGAMATTRPSDTPPVNDDPETTRRIRQALMRTIEADAPDVAAFLTEAQGLFGRPAECHLTLPGLNGGARTRVR